MLNNFNVTKTITILSSEWDQIFPTENLLRYGWSKVEGDDLYNFICEIKKSELNRIVQQERDFSKNMPMYTLIVELNYFQESLFIESSHVIYSVWKQYNRSPKSWKGTAVQPSTQKCSSNHPFLPPQHWMRSYRQSSAYIPLAAERSHGSGGHTGLQHSLHYQ